MAITIAVADDHRLFLKSLGALIANYPGLSIVAEGINGKELIDRMAALPALPDIIIIDVNMPTMDGEATAKHIHEKYPEAKIVALSMKDDDRSIIKMIRAGCCAYLLKDIHPDELEKALHEIHSKGSYNADTVNINYRRLLQYTQKEEALNITEKELQFLQLACSDHTYKQIASDMNISVRSVEAHRECLFQKLNVQSRVGMALEALRRDLVKL